MIAMVLLTGILSGDNLVLNPGFEEAQTPALPKNYELKGSAAYRFVGYADETQSAGIVFDARQPGGEVSQTVTGIDQREGKWLRFTIRGRAEDGFKLAKEQLYLKMEFLSKGSTRDSGMRLIYREVETDRKDFTRNGNDGKAGAAVWRTYEFEELLPFPEVDGVKLTVGYSGGAAKDEKYASFYLDDFSLTQSDLSSRGLKEPTRKESGASRDSSEGMVPLGGRWFYRPVTGEKVDKTNLKVTYANADRLFYHDDRYTPIFAGSMTAWMKAGYMTRQGEVLKEDKFVENNVVVEFDGSEVVKIRAKNIPNHQTAKFPDTYGTQGYNPSYIAEQDATYYLPMNPKVLKTLPKGKWTEDANHRWTLVDGEKVTAMQLPMGSIGAAVNGVVFYNPFDAGMTDASSIMDRCCGHPSPDYRYHYHKYPICVNTPYVDKGQGHSPVIGFAFDGLPVYGPYETEGVMAKDQKSNPLDIYNAHFDEKRGWHYHVTPGQFPYIIGGYRAEPEMRNFRRPG